MARSLVFGRSSLIRIRLAGECLFSCTRATSSSLARCLSRNSKCIEFSVSTFKVEFTLNVNYALQFSSEPMRQRSMTLPMTNLSTHRFDYIASTALYSEASSQQRSYFSVLEEVAQASRLQQ